VARVVRHLHVCIKTDMGRTTIALHNIRTGSKMCRFGVMTLMSCRRVMVGRLGLMLWGSCRSAATSLLSYRRVDA